MTPHPTPHTHHTHTHTHTPRHQVVDLVYRTLLEDEDETVALPASLGRQVLKPLQWLQTRLPVLPFTNAMHTVDFIDEISRDKVVPAGAAGYADLGIVPQKVRPPARRAPGAAFGCCCCCCWCCSPARALAGLFCSPASPASSSCPPAQVTEGLAIEALRQSREGGYSLGDSSAIAKNLPTHIRKYYGMEVEQGK
jgi:hypothetical protein